MFSPLICTKAFSTGGGSAVVRNSCSGLDAQFRLRPRRIVPGAHKNPMIWIYRPVIRMCMTWSSAHKDSQR